MIIEMTKQRAISISDTDFERVSELAYLYTGIVLGNQQKTMVVSRLTQRLRDLNLDNIEDYLALIDTESKPEVSKFIQALTTQLNPFFSSARHFEFLETVLCPEWIKTKASVKSIRIWAAGCSTGEEAYSIAMTLKENMSVAEKDYKILATDLDSALIEKARQGRYGVNSLETISAGQADKWFSFDTSHPYVVTVKPELQEIIDFQCLNLLDDWPIHEAFDLIFCRNVLSYFNETIQADLVTRFADTLHEGAYLILGQSESLSVNSQRFRLLSDSIYQKIK